MFEHDGILLQVGLINKRASRAGDVIDTRHHAGCVLLYRAVLFTTCVVLNRNGNNSQVMSVFVSYKAVYESQPLFGRWYWWLFFSIWTER